MQSQQRGFGGPELPQPAGGPSPQPAQPGPEDEDGPQGKGKAPPHRPQPPSPEPPGFGSSSLPLGHHACFHPVLSHPTVSSQGPAAEPDPSPGEHPNGCFFPPYRHPVPQQQATLLH